MDSYSVGDVARLCGVTVRTLQYYDRIGLLIADRDNGGRRRYDAAHLDRLRQIQLLSRAGIGLDEVAEILHRDAGQPAAETYAQQVRLLEIAELRLRCQRTVVAAVADILGEHPDARLPADVVAATMSLDDTLLQFPDVTGPVDDVPGLDVEPTITDYFCWKADVVQAAIMIENDIAADSAAGRRLGGSRHRAARRVADEQSAAVHDVYLATERDHERWPPGDRDLHLRTKGFLDRCELSYLDGEAEKDVAGGGEGDAAW